MSWQPIETAPRDGTMIDVWAWPGERIPDVSWREEWGQWLHDDGNGLLSCVPTHWMPLPAPPEQSA
jgi:hypothetical protein